MTQHEHNLWQTIKGYFNVLPDKTDEEETIEQIKGDVAFHGSNLWVLIFAIFMASLGLNVNSTAVIIGAMLISPLMGPIIGMGLGVGISDLHLLRRSVTNYLVATVISILTATFYFAVTPITEAQSELLARTSPTLYDVLIALFGGAAGIVAISTKGKSNVIPGVAIATALMPPLCTAGYGLAMGRMNYFLGAFYLFFINSVFICLATLIGIRMMKFRRKRFVEADRLKRVQRYTVGIVILTMLPVTYMTLQIVKRSVTKSSMLHFVKNELSFDGTKIISHDLNQQNKTLNIVAIGRTIPPASIDRAKKQMADYKLEDYKLNIIQGSLSDSTVVSQLVYGNGMKGKYGDKELMEQASLIEKMKKQLALYTNYEQELGNIRPELKTLWPQVQRLSLSVSTETPIDSTSLQQYVLAVVNCNQPLVGGERERLRRWLQTRTKSDSLRLITTY